MNLALIAFVCLCKLETSVSALHILGKAGHCYKLLFDEEI